MEYLEMRGCIAHKNQVTTGLIQRLSRLLRQVAFENDDHFRLLSLAHGDLHVHVEGLIQEQQSQELMQWLSLFLNDENLLTLMTFERVRWELYVTFGQRRTQSAAQVFRPKLVVSN